LRLALCLPAALVAALCLAGVTAASGTETFTDPAGDAPAVAPDITSVAVSNDDQGLITFRVAVANRTQLGPDDAIAVPFATDDAGRLGVREDGANFILVLDGTSGPLLLRWNGDDMVDAEPRPASLSGSFTGGAATLTVRQEDLAPGFPDLSLPVQLQFYALGIAFNGPDVVAEDQVPNTSDQLLPYRLAEPRRTVVTYFAPPKRAKAGRAVAVRLGAAWSDSGRAVAPSRVVCRATVGRARLPVATSRIARYGSCSWSLPRSTRGKTLRGSITLVAGGSSVTRSFSTRVR
jgi:hypothetical protein